MKEHPDPTKEFIALGKEAIAYLAVESNVTWDDAGVGDLCLVCGRPLWLLDHQETCLHKRCKRLQERRGKP